MISSLECKCDSTELSCWPITMCVNQILNSLSTATAHALITLTAWRLTTRLFITISTLICALWNIKTSTMESGMSSWMQTVCVCCPCTWREFSENSTAAQDYPHSTHTPDRGDVKIPFVGQTEINVHCVLIYHITHYNKRSCREMVLCDVYNFALTAARWLEFKRPLILLHHIFWVGLVPASGQRLGPTGSWRSV